MLVLEPAFSPWLLLVIAGAAVLYSAVGHGGASGYLAAMALFGLEPAVMKPTALTMNVFVASLVLFRFSRAGHFRWVLFWPLAVGSIPMALLGGSWLLPTTAYDSTVGVLLIVAAVRLFLETRDREATALPTVWLSVLVGAVLGFVSGLTGVGGGIYLSPLLLFLGWANMRTSAAVAAAFILVTSIAGTTGYALAGAQWPAGLPLLVVAAVGGAFVGSELGLRKVQPVALRRALGVVLVIAGGKMMLGA
jgi:uncharacterized membrane protein YfcA